MSQGTPFRWNADTVGQIVLDSDSQRIFDEASALDQKVCEAFVTWRDTVYRYLLAVTNSPTDAEDLTQETFIRLFQDLRRGQRIDNLRAWLFRVAHNLAVDLSRRPCRVHAAESGLADQVEDLRKDSEPDAECRILERERIDRVLARLSPQERHCMELRTEGLRYREIAEVLGIRVPTVQTVLRRAVQKLSSESHE